MKINKRYKLHRACAKENSRYAINGAYLDKYGESPLLVATNGRILAAVPVDDADGDTAQIVPADAVKNATTGAGVFGLISANGHIKSSRGPGKPETEYPKFDDDARFPVWRDVVPNAEDSSKGEWLTIGLDASLLHDLANAIGSDGKVRLRIRLNPDRGKPLKYSSGVQPASMCAILVDALETHVAGAMGAIMPTTAF